MHDQSPALLWMMRAAFLLIALFILIFQLLPIDTAPQRWAGPNLLLAFAIAWCLRRPEFVPAVSLAAVFFLADLLLQRPPGLWSMLVLIGCEQLKRRGRGLRDANFLAEWMAVGVTVGAITIAYFVLLRVFFLPTASIGLTLFQMAMTLLCYPIVVAITHGLMRVRKAAPGDLDAFGQRA